MTWQGTGKRYLKAGGLRRAKRTFVAVGHEIIASLFLACFLYLYLK